VVASGSIAGTGAAGVLPGEFALEQNYPNPFNPTTTIRFALPREAYVRLEVYDVTGAAVAVLVDSTQPAGVHDVRFEAHNLASGMYICRIRAGAFMESRKMMLVR